MEDRNEFVSMLTSLPVTGKKIHTLKLFMTMAILLYKYDTFQKAPISPFQLFISLTPNFEYAEVIFMNYLPCENMMLLVKSSIFKGIQITEKKEVKHPQGNARALENNNFSLWLHTPKGCIHRKILKNTDQYIHKQTSQMLTGI